MKTNFEKFWEEHCEHLIADGCNRGIAYFIWLSALEFAVQMASETAQGKGRPFEVGDRVKSTYYGEGVITEDDGSKTPLYVEFEDGTNIWHYRNGFDNTDQGYITHLD